MNLIMLKNIGLLVGGIWIGAVLTHRPTDTQSPTLPTLTLQAPTPTPCEEQPQRLTDQVPPRPDIQFVANSTPTVTPRPQTENYTTSIRSEQCDVNVLLDMISFTRPMRIID